MSYDTHELAATNLIAQYIWDLMKSELGYDQNNYGGIAPISIAGQQQELASFSKPYVLMAWTRQPVDLWLVDTEVAAFTIYAKDTTDVSRFVNLLADKFKRLDEAATDVNNWVDSLASEPTQARWNAFKKYDMKSIAFTASSGPQPPLQEGGRFDGSVILSITYTIVD